MSRQSNSTAMTDPPSCGAESACFEPPTSPASSADSSVLVFVYGTLKRGFRNARHMSRRGVCYLTDGVTVSPLVLYTDRENRNRPCLTRIAGLGTRIQGELYTVERAVLPELDRFERVPTHYTRDTISVELVEDGSITDAYVYLNVTTPERVEELRNGTYDLLSDYSLDVHQTYRPRQLSYEIVTSPSRASTQTPSGAVSETPKQQLSRVSELASEQIDALHLCSQRAPATPQQPQVHPQAMSPPASRGRVAPVA